MDLDAVALRRRDDNRDKALVVGISDKDIGPIDPTLEDMVRSGQ